MHLGDPDHAGSVLDLQILYFHFVHAPGLENDDHHLQDLLSSASAVHVGSREGRKRETEA
jgi:hypothetical protein